MDLPQDTILVVDDEATVLNLCKLILSRGGFHVLEARGGPEALQLIQEKKPRIRLALLDVVMPGMNGIELAGKLLEALPGTEILLMSGYSINEVRNIVGGDNPYRIIWKPFKADSLLRMIQGVLDRSAQASS